MTVAPTLAEQIEAVEWATRRLEAECLRDDESAAMRLRLKAVAHTLRTWPALKTWAGTDTARTLGEVANEVLAKARAQIADEADKAMRQLDMDLYAREVLK